MRKEDRHYLIMEGDNYVAFDIWHDQVIDIYHVQDPLRAARFETEEGAKFTASRACWPRSLRDYKIVRC